MWKILQYKSPEDFVLATGKSYTVRKFCELAFKEINIFLDWHGNGASEVGRNKENGKILVEVDKRYFRPTEVDYLEGDATKARKKLNWAPKISLKSMVSEMVQSDIKALD